jgi:predicted lipoprotein with Yx(FWY)xxD motif
MRLRTWVGAVALVVALGEGLSLAGIGVDASCPSGERIRMPMPFLHNEGPSWYTNLPELERLADNVAEPPNTSPIVICENHKALGPGHALHHDIVQRGQGRFSHWGSDVIFSTSDSSDPNTNGRSYLLIMSNGLPAPRAISNTTVRVHRTTLYTFDKDSIGKSTCNGSCTATWLPYDRDVNADDPSKPGDWSAITRDDGTKMWAHKGKPVYFFKGDIAPRDAKGDGIDGVWHALQLPK